MFDRKRDQDALWIIAANLLTTLLLVFQVTGVIGNLVAAALLFLNAVGMSVCIVLMQQRKAKARVAE